MHGRQHVSAPGAANVRARGCDVENAPQSIPRTPLVSEVRKRNGPEVAATNAPEAAAVRPSMGGAAQEAAATCDKGSLSGAARASLGLTFSRNLFPTCQGSIVQMPEACAFGPPSLTPST